MRLHEQIHRIQEMMGIISEQEYFSNRLKLGKSGDDVTKLQDILNMDKTDDIFDEETDECVKQFQEFANIEVDGIVGPETTGKLNELIKGSLPGWSGCKKKDDEDLTPSVDNQTSNENSVISQNDIVGSKWKSCKAWTRSGGLNKWGDKISISKNNDKFLISYDGPASGLSIAHAQGGTDTIHQLFNVLICELNPFLAQGGMKPDLNGISFETGKSGKNSKLSISVPLKQTKGVYQIDRRGGWGHDPGPSGVSGKCKSVNQSGSECIGPVTKVAQGPFGKITEYFITYKV